MGFGDTSLFEKIEFVVLIAAFVIHLIGFAVPMWYSEKILGTTFSGGLWRRCTKAGGLSICSDLVGQDGISLPSWFEAVEAMETIGFLCLMAALVTIILHMFVMTEQKLLQLVTFILGFAAFAFIFIGICIYAGEANYPLDEYHFAFAFCIIAFILALVAAILGVLDYLGKSK